ncbi:hypothetical protein CHLRE_16g650050v5 [Chlamydomonas reinhardtii]|uniref:Rhodanese domain-containing protein n=1 Tax=Chlamydomonas reinhardtii TaxID=3055 RepID=A0A2K3CSR9_CHLRE|nr:uncharacterized protein CHLRE_16g650050v5 [Chlamydomonas reinhardtii]PNW71337.1 hypothetical protein CHLRE_16g650050v5 [Chlamydomonas reinhardtii]
MALVHKIRVGAPTQWASARGVCRAPAVSRMPVVVRAQQQQQQQEPAATSATTELGKGEGPTGLNVGRFRPTSPGGWAEMATALRQANLKVLAPQELPWVKEKGAVIVDIRPEESYMEGHLPDAVNVPFYQPIQGWTPWQVARRVGYAMFGISQGTEVNPKFLTELFELVPEPATTPVVIYCNFGGSLEPTKNDKNGQQTRSMVAAYALIASGFKNVAVLKGGYFDWTAQGRDIETFE